MESSGVVPDRFELPILSVMTPSTTVSTLSWPSEPATVTNIIPVGP